MTQINFRIEEDIKENAEKALKEMGLTMSSAITMFLVKVGREKRIPFEITADPFYSESNIRYLEKIAADIKNGKATFSEHAWEDYVYWQFQDKKTLKKINRIITDICRNPFEGIGKPEPLKENLSGFWSRRIDDNGNRVVYFIKDDTVCIIACKGHYE